MHLFKFGIYHELFWTFGIEKSLNVNANVHLLGQFNAILSREFWQHEQNPYQNSLGLWLHSFTDTPKGCRVWIGCTYYTVCSGTCECQERWCLPTGSGSPRESLRFFFPASLSGKKEGQNCHFNLGWKKWLVRLPSSFSQLERAPKRHTSSTNHNWVCVGGMGFNFGMAPATGRL